MHVEVLDAIVELLGLVVVHCHIPAMARKELHWCGTASYDRAGQGKLSVPTAVLWTCNCQGFPIQEILEERPFAPLFAVIL